MGAKGGGCFVIICYKLALAPPGPVGGLVHFLLEAPEGPACEPALVGPLHNAPKGAMLWGVCLGKPPKALPPSGARCNVQYCTSRSATCQCTLQCWDTSIPEGASGPRGMGRGVGGVASCSNICVVANALHIAPRDEGGGAHSGRSPTVTQEHPMPQFDIASLHPQITFFAGILSTSHVSSCKNILPKVSQNSKPNRRIAEIHNVFAVKGSRDPCLPSHIYQPAKIVSHSVPREVLRLICSGRFIDQITISYMSPSNRPSRHESQHAKIRLLQLSNIYLSTSSDTYSSTTKARHSK
jgi:hypothetical protein